MSDGTGDADGDGSTDLEEFWAGTNPTVQDVPQGSSGISCAPGGAIAAGAWLLALAVIALARRR